MGTPVHRPSRLFSHSLSAPLDAPSSFPLPIANSSPLLRKATRLPSELVADLLIRHPLHQSSVSPLAVQLDDKLMVCPPRKLRGTDRHATTLRLSYFLAQQMFHLDRDARYWRRCHLGPKGISRTENHRIIVRRQPTQPRARIVFQTLVAPTAHVFERGNNVGDVRGANVVPAHCQKLELRLVEIVHQAPPRHCQGPHYLASRLELFWPVPLDAAPHAVREVPEAVDLCVDSSLAPSPREHL
eukprot:3378932-Pyramimonas_sp.AAC.2